MKQINIIRKKEATVVLFVLFVFYAVSFSQDNKSSEGKLSKRPVVEDIFQDIMQTIPSDVKADIDSIKIKNTVIDNNEIHQNNNVNENIKSQISKDKRLLELPEKVRNQVEKAIKEIERNREERVLEFKEMKKKKKE